MNQVADQGFGESMPGRKLFPNRVFFWVVYPALLILIVLLSMLLIRGKNNHLPEGRIVFRRISHRNRGNSSLQNFEYFIMDGEGNNIQHIGYYRGAPEWSPDGDLLAVSCEDYGGSICILDMKSLPDLKHVSSGIEEYFEYFPRVINEILLPRNCRTLVSYNYGLESISWSYDGTKLAVVCGSSDNSNIHKERMVCILDISTNESSCWEDYQINIYSIEWSPTEDQLLISQAQLFTPKLYLVGPNGNDPQFIAEGWSGTWSPDGKQIAYAKWQNDFLIEIDGEITIDPSVNKYIGIASQNIDGSKFEWLYRNTEDIPAKINLSCDPRPCKMSWSPDGEYLVFQNNIGGMENYKIYKLGVHTGELLWLSSFEPQYIKYLEPDWGL